MHDFFDVVEAMCDENNANAISNELSLSANLRHYSRYSVPQRSDNKIVKNMLFYWLLN